MKNAEKDNDLVEYEVKVKKKKKALFAVEAILAAIIALLLYWLIAVYGRVSPHHDVFNIGVIFLYVSIFFLKKKIKKYLKDLESLNKRKKEIVLQMQEAEEAKKLVEKTKGYR